MRYTTGQWANCVFSAQEAAFRLLQFIKIHKKNTMKLHLPKALFTALLVAGSAAYASTGWSGNEFYIGGGQPSHLDNTINTGYQVIADDESTADVNERQTVIEVVDASGKTGTLLLWSDDPDSGGAATNARFGELKVAADTTIDVGTNSWDSSRYFDTLTIDKVSVTDGGATSLNISKAEHKVNIGDISGTLTDVSTAGSLTMTATSGSVSGKLYANGGNITLGDGTNSGTLTVNRVEVADANGGTSTFTVESNYTLKVTGDANTIQNDTSQYKTNSFVVSEWANSTTMNVKGTILAENAAVMTGDSGVTINIENGGTLATKGLGRSNPGKTAISTVNLKDGGTLVLGDMGMDYDGKVTANISGGKIGIAADTVTIADALNITGNLSVDTTQYSYGESGLTQGTTGGKIVFGSDLTGGGTLTASGAGSLEFGAISSGVSISTGTAGVNFTGTLVMGDGTTFTVGSGSFSVDASNLENFSVQAGASIVDKEGNTATNGFAAGARTVIDGGTIDGEFTLTHDGETYTINNENRTFGPSDYIDLGTWYITSGNSTLSEIYAQSSSAAISAAGGTTLNVDTTLSTGLELTGNATMNISQGTILAASAITTNGNKVTLDGSGTYSINRGNATNVALAEGWTGLVELFGQGSSSSHAALDLTSYGHSGSTISIKEYVGYFINDGNGTKNIDANLVLTNTSLAAVEILNGYSGGVYNFNGSVSGDGNFIVGKNLNGGKMTFNFKGDTSGWTGKMEVTAGEHNVKYTGVSTINNGTIQARNGESAKMNLTIENTSAAVTVNSTITNNSTSTVNLEVNAAKGATFTNNVTVNTTTLAAGTTATFNGTTDLGSLTLGDGASVTGSGSLTLGALNLNLESYTTAYTTTHTLVSTTGTLTFNGDLSGYQGVTVGNYTANVALDGNSITLSFTEIPPADPTAITTTVSSVGAFANGVLTLNVDSALAGAGSVHINGISDAIMKDILGLSGLPEDGMVGITLVGTDAATFAATDDEMVGFLAKDGINYYYGEQVGSAWQYQVAYIPEPATATLSLLALAGLAARRRRKY